MLFMKFPTNDVRVKLQFLWAWFNCLLCLLFTMICYLCNLNDHLAWHTPLWWLDSNAPSCSTMHDLMNIKTRTGGSHPYYRPLSMIPGLIITWSMHNSMIIESSLTHQPLGTHVIHHTAICQVKKWNAQNRCLEGQVKSDNCWYCVEFWSDIFNIPVKWYGPMQQQGQITFVGITDYRQKDIFSGKNLINV